MIVRQLVTLLGFRVDKSGAKDYDKEISSLKGAVRRVEASVRGMNRGFASTNKLIGDMGRKMQILNKKIDQTNAGVGRIRNSFIGMNQLIAGAFAGLSVRELARTADYMVSLEARFSQMSQTQGDAADTFNAVGRAAIEARQPIREFGNLYARLGQATRDILPAEKDVLELTSSISKSFVIGSLSAEEQKSAMYQLSQAFNKGKLDGDEFRAVMEAMPGQITRALAAAMGYDNLALFYKAREQGELTVERLIKGFQKLKVSIDQQFKEMPLTIGQGLTIVGNRFSMFIAKMNRESGAVTDIANAIIWTFDKLESGADSVAESLGGMANAVKGLGMLLAAVTIPIGLRMLATALVTIVSPAGLVVAGILALIAVGEDLYQWMNGGESVLGDWLGSWEDFRKGIDEGVEYIKKDWQKMVDGIERGISAIKRLWLDLKSFFFGEEVSLNAEGNFGDINPNTNPEMSYIPPALDPLGKNILPPGSTLPERKTTKTPAVSSTSTFPRTPSASPDVAGPSGPSILPPVSKPLGGEDTPSILPPASSPTDVPLLGTEFTSWLKKPMPNINLSLPKADMAPVAGNRSFSREVNVAAININVPAGSDGADIGREVRKQLELPSFTDMSTRVMA